MPNLHNAIKVDQAMLAKKSAPVKIGLGITLVSCLLMPGCRNDLGEISKEIQPPAIFQMGQGVPVGQLTYNVIETKWRSQLGGGPSAKIPKNRFLLVKLTISNANKQTSSIPEMTLVNASGENFQELTEGIDSVDKWLGVLRNLSPGQTEEGMVVFDVPLGAYKLMVLDGGDPGAEKKALIEIPLQLE